MIQLISHNAPPLITVPSYCWTKSGLLFDTGENLQPLFLRTTKWHLKNLPYVHSLTFWVEKKSPLQLYTRTANSEGSKWKLQFPLADLSVSKFVPNWPHLRNFQVIWPLVRFNKPKNPFQYVTSKISTSKPICEVKDCHQIISAIIWFIFKKTEKAFIKKRLPVFGAVHKSRKQILRFLALFPLRVHFY